jgi:hypothetical protein
VTQYRIIQRDGTYRPQKRILFMWFNMSRNGYISPRAAQLRMREERWRVGDARYADPVPMTSQ